VSAVPAGGRVVDLSMPVRPHFRWKLERDEQRYELPGGGGFLGTRFTMATHAFTHMDAPVHMVPGGATTTDVPLESLVGEACVLDLSGQPDNAPVTAARLVEAGGHLKAGEIVLTRTGWSARRSAETRQFWTEAPWMTREACDWLLERRPRAVLWDFPQDQPIRLLLDHELRPMAEQVTHDVLLRNGVVMVEYVCNTLELKRPRTYVCALPLKLMDADGAPARVIAIEAD
jgi:kynurenine formamidase